MASYGSHNRRVSRRKRRTRQFTPDAEQQPSRRKRLRQVTAAEPNITSVPEQKEDIASSSCPLTAGLHTFFGHTTFRHNQRPAITSILNGDDTLVIAPTGITGSGKSVIFQLPSLLNTSFALVLSPLIALQADQCQQLRARGIDARYFNSTTLSTEKERILLSLESVLRDKNTIRLLFTTPESLCTRD